MKHSRNRKSSSSEAPTGSGAPAPVVSLSDSDISRLATEVVAIYDRYNAPTATSEPGTGAPAGDSVVVSLG